MAQQRQAPERVPDSATATTTGAVGPAGLDEHLLDLQLVQRHLRLEPKPLGAADADRVPEVATGGGADEQERETEDVRDEHAVRRNERHRAEDRRR